MRAQEPAKIGLYTGLPRWAPGYSGAARRPQSGSTPRWRSASSARRRGPRVQPRRVRALRDGAGRDGVLPVAARPDGGGLADEVRLPLRGRRGLGPPAPALQASARAKARRRRCSPRLALLALAPLSEWIFGSEDLALPLAIAAALPLVQAPGERRHHRTAPPRPVRPPGAVADVHDGLRLARDRGRRPARARRDDRGDRARPGRRHGGRRRRRDRGVPPLPERAAQPPSPTIAATSSPSCSSRAPRRASSRSATRWRRFCSASPLGRRRSASSGSPRRRRPASTRPVVRCA